jgi:hypothetical protein
MGIASFFEERGREFLNLSKLIRFKRGTEELYSTTSPSVGGSIENTTTAVPAADISECSADYTTPEAYINTI